MADVPVNGGAITATGYQNGDEQPATKKRKTPGRTRAACEACRSNKQRCDAQTSYPCRRCQLYGLECKLDDVTTNGPQAARPPGAAAGPVNAVVGDRLQDIVERLSRIEFAVNHTQWASQNGHVPTSSPPHFSPPGISPGSQPSASSGPAQPLVEVVAQSLDDGALQQVRSVTANYNALMEEKDDPSQQADAIKRGIVTEDVARELFNFYFQHLEGETLPLVSQDQDGDMAAVRARSPLLFNTILLAAAYYTFLGSDHGRAAYEELANLEAELLGPTLLFARMNSHHLSLSTIRALMINCCRKPLIHANIAGSAVPLAQQFLSKLDLTAAVLPLSLAIRMSFLLNLRKQALAVLDSRNAAKPTLHEMWLVRTWFSLCMIEAQGSLQAGRLPQTAAVDDEAQLERFHAIRTRETDTQQAAYIAATRPGRDARWNLFETTRQKTNCAQHPGDIAHLRVYLAEYARWRDVWVPRLGHNKLFFFMSRFLHLVLLSKYVTLWAEEWRLNGAKRPYTKFTAEQRHILREAVRAASEGLFALSMEARAPETIEGRRVEWTPMAVQRDEKEGTVPVLAVEPLTPDLEMVQLIAKSIDTINCVVVPFLALFLASQSGRSMSCNLECLEPDSLNDWKEPRYIYPEGKLRRLLDLTATVLEQAAPNSTHPATGHSRMIRSLIIKSSRAPPPPPGYCGGDPNGFNLLAPAPVPSMPTNSMPTLSQPPLGSTYPEPFLSAPVVAAPGVEPAQSETFDYASIFGVDLNLGSDTDIDWAALGLIPSGDGDIGGSFPSFS